MAWLAMTCASACRDSALADKVGHPAPSPPGGSTEPAPGPSSPGAPPVMPPAAVPDPVAATPDARATEAPGTADAPRPHDARVGGSVAPDAATTAPSAKSMITWRRHVLATDVTSRTAVAADFTGDGRLDIIAGDDRKRESILFIAPDWRRRVIQTAVESLHSDAYDVDGDGDIDCILATYNPGKLVWVERPADPERDTWNVHPIDSLAAGGPDGIHGVLAADVDHDGALDLIAVSSAPQGPFPNSILWYKTPRGAAVQKPWPRFVVADKDAPGATHYLAFGDLDRDGRGEILTGAKNGNYFAGWSRGPAAGPWRRTDIATNQVGATNVAVIDVNGDSVLDVVASRGHGTGIVWFEGPSMASRTVDATIIDLHSLAMGDIDGDGDVDIASAQRETGMTVWFENDGKGRFVRHVIHADQAAYDVRLADLDGDGDLDLLAAGQKSYNLVWHEND